MCAAALPALGNDWAPKDSLLLGGAVGLMALDWAQTRHISLNPQTFFETNPLLGLHPHPNQVDRYFLLATAGTGILAFALPLTYRRIFLGSVIALETVVVMRNHHIGVQIGF